MKRKNFSFVLILVAVFLTMFSCEKKKEKLFKDITLYELTDEKATFDSVPEDVSMNSQAAGSQDPNRKFVKTASAEFETKDVYKTARSIEQKVSELKGFIANSNISSEILEEKEFETSSDSVLQVRKVQVHGLLIVKIPQEKLAVFLDDIKPFVVFLHNRYISADDVTLTYEGNDLDESRLNKAQKRIEKNLDSDGKLGDKNQTILSASEIEREKNEAIKRGKELVNKIKMSEVTLRFSQKPMIVELSVPNTHKFKQYEREGFFYDLWRAIVEGFYILQVMILVFFRLWPIWVIVFGIVFLVKWIWKLKKS